MGGFDERIITEGNRGRPGDQPCRRDPRNGRPRRPIDRCPRTGARRPDRHVEGRYPGIHLKGHQASGRMRSEERRAGKEGVGTGRSRWSPCSEKKKKKKK